MTARPRLSNRQALGRKSLKRFLYSQLSMRSAGLIAGGREAPLIAFTVEGSPPSIYLNFELDAQRLSAFTAEIALPDGLSLCPIRCLAGDEPRYLVTLNVYRVSGLVHGLRAEWSTYVRDDSGKPRYMILEARSSERSMDPISLVTKADRVEHAVVDGQLRTCVVSKGSSFRAQLPVPDGERMLRATIHPEWVEANDYIYWRNGVADRAFYGGSLANPELCSLPVAAEDVRDETPFRAYLSDAPPQAVAFLAPIELVLSPWCNV